MKIDFIKRFAFALLLANNIYAGVIYIDRAFDYAGTLTEGEALTNSVEWTGNTEYITWNSKGLENEWLGGTTGGAAEITPQTFISRSINTPLDTYLTYEGYSQGSTFWFTALFRTEVNGSINDTTQIDFYCSTRPTSSDVNRLIFKVKATNAFCKAFSDGGLDAYTEVKIASGVSTNETHMFLARLTVGTPDSPTDSKWDFWFDPIKTYTASDLGNPDGTIPASKGGRSKDNGVYQTTKVSISFDGWENENYPKWDEIRAGDTFAEVLRIPIHGTSILVK